MWQMLLRCLVQRYETDSGDLKYCMMASIDYENIILSNLIVDSIQTQFLNFSNNIGMILLRFHAPVE